MLGFASHVSSQILAGPVMPLSPEIMNPNNGHIYIMLTQGNWTESEAKAVSLGGHLVTINNQAEEDWVASVFSGYGAQVHNLWLGLRYAKSSNHFFWTSGSRIKYTNWGFQQPNLWDGLQPYAAIMPVNYRYHLLHPQWRSWGDTVADMGNLPFNGVVEIVPPRSRRFDSD